MGPIVYPTMSVRNYHYSLRNNPAEHSSHLDECCSHGGGGTKYKQVQERETKSISAKQEKEKGKKVKYLINRHKTKRV